MRRDRGSVALEFVGVVPIVILVGMLMLQAGAVMWTASSTGEAARQAARAFSLGQDPRAAAEASLPSGITVVSLSVVGPGHGVRLTTQAPKVSPMPAYRLARQVIMP